jgi:hypothetical protein
MSKRVGTLGTTGGGNNCWGISDSRIGISITFHPDLLNEIDYNKNIFFFLITLIIRTVDHKNI